MCKVGILCCGLLFGLAAGAEVYKRVDQYGNVSYSDTPGEDSELVKLGAINLQPPVTPRPARPTPTPPAPTPARSQAAVATPPAAIAEAVAVGRQVSPSTGAPPSIAAPQIAPPSPESGAAAQKYGLRIALPKPGSQVDPGAPITLILLSNTFLSGGERFQATVNGRPVGEKTVANNMSILLPKFSGSGVSLGAQVVNTQGQILEQAPSVQVFPRSQKAPK